MSDAEGNGAPIVSRLSAYCSDCWYEAVVVLVTSLDESKVPGGKNVMDNNECAMFRDIAISKGPELRISLASAALYYQICAVVHTLKAPLEVYKFLELVALRIDQIRKNLGSEVSSIPMEKDSDRKAKINFLYQFDSLVIDYAATITDPQMVSGFYGSFKEYCEVAGDNTASKLPLLVIMNRYNESTSNGFEQSMGRYITFFSDVIGRYKQKGTLEAMVIPMLKLLSSSVRRPNSSPINDKSALTALNLLVKGDVTLIIPKLPFWLPKNNTLLPSEIQRDTFLGPFLSSYNIYPEFGSDLTTVYFPENSFSEADNSLDSNDIFGFYIGNRRRSDIESAVDYISSCTKGVYHILHDCIMRIIRVSSEGKEAVLQYISTVTNFNKARTKMQSNSKKHCSDGFMHNLSIICMMLCGPFTSKNNISRVHLVDPDYLFLSDRIDNTDFVGINSDIKQMTEYSANISADTTNMTHNFITEIFFLTLFCNHVGILTICNSHMTLIKEIELVKERVKRMREEKKAGKWANRPSLMANDFILRFNERQLEELTGNRLCIDAMLKNTTTIDSLLSFYNFVLLYTIRCTLLSRSDIKSRCANKLKDDICWDQFFMGRLQNLNVELPPDAVPDVIAHTPEWVLEDICDFYTFFLNNYERSTIKRESLDELMTFMIIFLKNLHIIKNPYIQAKLVEILHFLIMPVTRDELGGPDFTAANPLLYTHGLAIKYLVEVLLDYYVAVEHNSMTNQFYERFKMRYFISQILGSAFSHVKHQEKLLHYTRDAEAFTKFALLLTNDVSYLLDESIGKLREIQHLEQELSNKNQNRNAEGASGNTNAGQSDEEKEARLRALEEQATSYISLGNEALKFFYTLVVDFNIVDQFLAPEICERLTAMLNYNLTALVGPKCMELKVNNPSKYLFEPRRMLEEVVSIYMKFIDSDSFVVATSKDCRSYRKGTFERAVSIIKRSSINLGFDVEVPLMAFVDRVEKKIESQNSYYEKLGGIPEEFLDPLVYSLMEDPVILPRSGVTVDRSTIKTHLLADEHDPYNRTPLKLSEVIDNTELKQKIQQWLESKKIDNYPE